MLVRDFGVTFAFSFPRRRESGVAVAPAENVVFTFADMDSRLRGNDCALLNHSNF
jgi:hypothetical protein